MNPSTPKRFWLQVAVILSIGAAAGIVDSAVRPIQIGREAPPPLPTATQPLSPGQGTSVPAKTPPTATGTPTSTTPPASGTVAPIASGPDCTLTPKDKLPSGHITIDEAKALFDSRDPNNPPEQGGPGAVFIDTRKQAEFEAGHVAGSIRISLQDFSRGDPMVLNFIDRSAAIVTYCVGGNCDESEAVAQQLSLIGYKKVYVMHDGFPCWLKLGHPSETGPGAFP